MESGLQEHNGRQKHKMLCRQYMPVLLKHSYLVVILLFLVDLSACNPTISVYKDNGKYYSIFGFINASADTQYIRIEELRDSMPRSTPVHLNASVKLTDLTANRPLVMHDSLFHFLEGPAHNYYTTDKIIPLHTYRLAVTGQNGDQSSAQIKMPGPFPKPLLEEAVDPTATLGCQQYSGIYVEVRITGISRLVAVNAVYYTVHTSETGKKEYSHWSFEHLADTTHISPGVVMGKIDYDKDLCETNVAYDRSARVQRMVVVVAAGNQDWPNFLALDSETETVPGVATNIKNGVGLFGGVITDTLEVYTHY